MGELTRRIGIHFPGVIVVSLLVCVASTGCVSTRGNGIPPNEPVRAVASGDGVRIFPEEIPPALPVPDEPEPGSDNVAQHTEASPSEALPFAETIPASDPLSLTPAGTLPETAPPDAEARQETLKANPPVSSSAAVPEKKARTEAAGEQENKPVPLVPAQQKIQPPPWASQRETLAFRVNFLGITMGYARFRYSGKVSIGGKEAYHINVRAWTSGVLSFLYPVNEMIEYYLDAETSQPVRIEYIGKKNKRDDAATYDQENGKIVYRYLDDGKIRKTVDIVPACYDPVSAIYHFRWRDMGREDRPVNMYGGRKVYQIAARLAGNARLTTANGPVDTLVVEPVIWREGKLENKGELRMWVTDDGRRTPVKIYGKFRKVRDWTLVGELLPEQPER